MNTKFNIGDIVEYVCPISGRDVFTVTKIRIDIEGICYLNAIDWIPESRLTPYIEPKKKVIKYLWSYQFKSGVGYHNVSSVFLDDKTADTYFRGEQYSRYERLDWSATEFEVEP